MVLQESRRALGVFQHHDGITGTAKDHVVIDYGSKLFRAISGLQTLSSQLIGELLQDKSTAYIHDVNMEDQGAVESRTVVTDDRYGYTSTDLAAHALGRLSY